MSISIDIDTKGLETILSAFIKSKVDKGLKDCKAIAELIRDDIKENIFNARKIPSGTMAKNRPSTIAIKGFNAPMIDSGELYDNIKVQPITDGHEVFIDGELNNKKVEYNSKSWTQTEIYGKPMTPHKRAARPFFGIRTAIKKDIRNILNG